MLKIVIPKTNTPYRKVIAKGSGVVMLPFNEEDPWTSIYYEGNLYNAVNLHKFSERIVCAAGRAHTSYPTIATLGVHKSMLDLFHLIGECFPENYYAINMDISLKDPILSQWLDKEAP